jgi:hypothetical protein
VKTIDGTKETFYQLTTSEWLTLCNKLNLSFAAMKVLMYLRTMNPWGDRKVEAETKDLAQALNLNIRTVQRCLHELDDKKLIELEFNRFKFTLKSHTATSTSPDDQNVATSTSPDDQNVATSTSPDDQNVATSTSLERHGCRQDDTEIAKTTSMSRTPSESTDGQGFQKPSYYSYSSDNLNNPPISPQRGDGGTANAFQSQEVIVHEPDEPEQNTTSVNNSNPVKGQSSAPRRRSPSKAVEGIKRQYRDKLPDWRTGYGVGDYCIGFKFFFQLEVIDKLPESSIWKTYTPAQLIEENEAKGNFAGLEERCKQWQIFEARRQAEVEARAIAAQPPPQVPLIDKPAEIDRIMIIQGLTPADVLGGMRSHPDYRYSMAKVHRDPEVAWAELANGTLSLVHSYLAKLEPDAATPTP